MGSHAAHLQRADLGHAGLQLHLDLGLVTAFGRRQHGGQGGQLDPALAVERRDASGLRRRRRQAVGHQGKAHGLAQAQRKAPA